MEQNTFDFSRLVATAKRHKWLYIISLVVCLTLAGLYLYRTPKTYSITAQVMIDDQEGNGGMLKALSIGKGGSDVENELQLMDAHRLLTQAIRELGIDHSYFTKINLLKTKDLYGQSPLKVMAPQSVLDTLSESLIFKIKVNKQADKIDVAVKKSRFSTLCEAHGTRLPMTVKTPYGIYSIDTTAYYVPGKKLSIIATIGNPSVIAQGMNNLKVTRSSKKSQGITLSCEDIVPQRAIDLLNKMIEIYNRWSQDKKNETALNTGRFIDERLNYIYAELNDSEAGIENFKRSHGLTDPQAETSIQLQKRAGLENQITGLQTQAEVLKMLKQFISEPENRYELIPFIEGTSDDAMKDYNELILKRMALLETAKPNNIAVQTLSKQIDAMRGNVATTVDRALASARVRLQEISSKNRQESGVLSQFPGQERQYRDLMRQQTIKNELYKFLLEKREENQLLLAASLPKGQIVDEAYKHNKPVAPKASIILFLGLVLGLLMPTIVLYVKSLLNNKFENQDELSRLTDVPVIGEMAHSRRAQTQGLVIKGNSVDPVAELFRLMRSNLAFMLPAPKPGQGSVIAVTSSIGHEGKSFIASNLAETIALMGKKVVLVGFDIRKPMLAKYLDLRPEPGVTNYLSDPSINIDSLLQPKADFQVIVAGPIPPNPTELLLGDRTQECIEALRKQFDYVLLDTAPLGLVSDSFSLIKFADLTLYVTRAKYTLKSHIKMLNRYVADKRLGSVALVINDVHLDRNTGYGYGYSLDDKDDK